MRTRAVIFDLDDTLIVEEAFARESLRAAVGDLTDDTAADEAVLQSIRPLWYSGPCYDVCRELGIASWEGLWATFEGAHEVLSDLHGWIQGYRDAAWSAVASDLGGDPRTLKDSMGQVFADRQRSGHPVHEGAGTLVESIASNSATGILTNGPPDIQRLKLEQSGLAHMFGSVVISGEKGVGKPDGRVFEMAVEELGCAPSDAVMVGDSWERDVEGALGAGLRPIWIAWGRTAPQIHSAVTIVETLPDVIGAL